MERQKAGQGTGQRDWGWGGRTRCRLRHRDGEGKKKNYDGLLDRDGARKSRARVGKRERKKGTAGWTGGYN